MAPRGPAAGGAADTALHPHACAPDATPPADLACYVMPVAPAAHTHAAAAAAGGAAVEGKAGVEQLEERSAAERRVERKIMAHILVPMALFSLLNFIDRSNLAFAAPQLERDLGFDNEVFGLAAGLFFVTYASLQVPAQLLSMHLGGPRALGALAICWGAAAAGMAGVRNKAGLFAQRLLLGAFEAGALPAMWMVNSQWFPTYRLTIPSTCIMMAITVAQAISGPLAAGLFALEGRIPGLRDWQIMFLFEGVPSIILGICMWLFMPRSIHAARFLSPEEKALWSRLVAATDSAVTPSEAGSWRAMRDVLRTPVVWCAGVWRGCYGAALYGVMYFTPLVLRSLRFGGSGGSGGHQPNASTTALLASIPFVLGAIAHLLNALHSSHTGERRAHIATPWMLGGVLMAVAPVPLIHHHQLGTFVLFTAGAVGINAADGPDVSWVTSLMAGRQRALGLATANMLANVGSFIGPYCIGSLSKATRNWHASLWFVSGAIFLAGAFVAAFPLRWAAHNDAPQIEERRSSELALRAARAHSSGGGHSVVAV